MDIKLKEELKISPCPWLPKRGTKSGVFQSEYNYSSLWKREVRRDFLMKLTPFH
ncbi:MAG: hypothetical protein HY754_15345 [Nitrospirae bacterium]|nr:hypothetical protein [Nitrospirota bacterium]